MAHGGEDRRDFLVVVVFLFSFLKLKSIDILMFSIQLLCH